MLQETLPTSPPAVGSRFRPYASPNHHVTKGRYITSNDPRGYIPVYEYPLNGQWIMMDIDDGYILWTGIWKALGNSKADIVKMIDSQPDLAPLIRRVRGGYLKIQGTWMPYEVALRLSRRVAWPIRDDLVPLFGPTFPSTCLSPDQPGYGQVVNTGSNRRRARRATTQSAPNPVGATTETHAGWMVTTNTEAGPSQPPHSSPRAYSLSSQFQSMRDRETRPHHSYRHPSPPSSYRPAHTHAPSESTSPSLVSRERSASVRYSPYVAHSPYPASRRLSPNQLSLDIPALSIKDRGPSSAGATTSIIENKINLPPLKAPTQLSSSLGGAPYALPPISAMEDLRGIHASDSAAVLRRLRDDDDSGPSSLSHEDESERLRRRSFSFQPYRSPVLQSAVRAQEAPRSYPNSAYRSRTPVYSSDESDNGRHRHSGHRGHPGSLSLSVPSDASHDGMSTCDPSPISPATPRSATSTGYPGFLSPHHQPALLKSRRVSESFHPLSVPTGEWAGSRRPSDALPAIESAFPRRHSDADSEMAHPHRPW